MKRIFAALLLFVVIPAFSQTAPAAPSPSTKALTELQQAKVQVAIKDFQIAQMQVQQAQQSVANARNAALAQIEAVRKELGLDDTWEFNEQQNVFVKKPQSAKVEAPKK